MRKVLKWLLISLVIILILAAGIYSVLRFGYGMDLLDRSGWKEDAGQVQYLDYYGRPLLGWQEIQGKTYYFDADSGSMHTGWLELNGERYRMADDGAMLTGWVDTPEGRFFLKEDGTVFSGWRETEEGTYYLLPETGMAKGWLELEQKRYYFNSQGILQSGWVALKEGQYYLGEDGAAVTGWQELHDERYFFGEDGAVLTGWQELDGNRYHFSGAGAMTTGWLTEGGKFYFSDEGILQTGWQEIEGDRYYFNEDGAMHTGWLEEGEDRYYLREDGIMAVGEVVIDGVSNFFTSKGKYVVMVNPWHLMPEDYELNLAPIGNFQFDADACDDLQTLLDACRAAGYACSINNTYRSVETQQYMWDVRIKERLAEGMTREEAIAEIGKSLALVGASEHHLGLAVDIDGGDAAYKWLAENCWDYGFILRYPDDKIEITGIIYEPWHFRYVGTELSLELEELGLCMEEYMDMLTASQQAG